MIQGYRVGQMLPVVADFFTTRADSKPGEGIPGAKGQARHERTLILDGKWQPQALCTDPRLAHVDFLSQADPHATEVCIECPVRVPCLARALVEEQGYNTTQMATTRGGFNVIDRYRLRKRIERKGWDGTAEHAAEMAAPVPVPEVRFRARRWFEPSSQVVGR